LSLPKVEIANHNELNTGSEQHMHDQFHETLLEAEANTFFLCTPIDWSLTSLDRVHQQYIGIIMQFSSWVRPEANCNTKGQPLSRPGEADLDSLGLLKGRPQAIFTSFF
jgi:hypothetical protein